MKRILTIFSILGFIAFPHASFAAPHTGELIQGSGSAVYYHGADGKRYVFPNEKTYATWYDNFDAVTHVTDAELASIPLGDNITYRPGVRMVKIESDPKVYAVAEHGTLRWIETEAVAEALYGPNWSEHVDDISVALFTNYTLGTKISTAQEYVPSTITNNSLTLQDDLNITPQEPAPNPTPSEPALSATFTSSKSSVIAGDAVDVFATAESAGSIRDIYIYLDTEEKQFCEYSPCGASFIVPPGKNTYSLRAEFTWITGETLTKTIPLTVVSDSANGVTFHVTNPEVKPGNVREAVVLVDNSLIVDTTTIYLDGNIVKVCDNVQECRYSGVEDGVIGDVHTLYARVQNQGNAVVFSGNASIQVVENDHPQITFRLGKDMIFVGEMNDVTIETSDVDGVTSTEIWLDGNLVKHCSLSICTANLGPFSTTGTRTIIGKAKDTLGLEQISTTSFDVN